MIPFDLHKNLKERYYLQFEYLKNWALKNVSNLPSYVASMCKGWDVNPGPSDCLGPA